VIVSAGWVLVQTEDDSASRVVDALTSFDGVELAERTAGAYDVVVRVADAGPTVPSAKRVLQATLRVPGVTLAVCCHDGDAGPPQTVDLTDSHDRADDDQADEWAGNRAGELHSVR
jgi:hypothetical protein